MDPQQQQQSVQTFKMPENLNIAYKFFGGKLSFKELAVRMIGLPIAIPAALLIYFTTHLFPLAGIIGGLWFVIGWWFGAKKVFDKQMPLIQALILNKRLKDETPVLINTRMHRPVVEEANSKPQTKGK